MKEKEKTKRETMESKVVVISVVAGFLGLLAVILGLVAEVTRIKVSKNISGFCLLLLFCFPLMGSYKIVVLFLFYLYLLAFSVSH